MISPAEFAGCLLGSKRKNAPLGPFAPDVAVAASRIFLGFEDRDVWTVAKEIGCSVEFLLWVLEGMSEARAELNRAEEAS